MRVIFGAVFGIFLAAAGIAVAQCNCTVTVGPPIVFTEDPLILAEEGVTFHAMVEEVYFDAGECVVFINFPDGVTSTYKETTGDEVHHLRLAPHVAAHPAFARYGNELTLSEVVSAATSVCAPVDQPTS